MRRIAYFLLALLTGHCFAVVTVQKIYQGTNESQVTSKTLNRELGFDSTQNAMLFKTNNGTVIHGISKETKAPILDSTLQINKLTAGFGVAADGSKKLISVPFVGTDSIVKNVGPVIWTPTINSPTISGGTGNFTTLQQGGVQAVTTSGSQTLTNKSIVASQITAGTFGTGNYTFSGKVLADSLRSTVGRVQAYNASGQGTYIELAKYQGSLPPNPTSYYPTLKTDYNSLYMVANGKFVSELQNDGSSLNFILRNYAQTNNNIVLRSDGDSYFGGGKIGVSTTTPDSTLTVTGSGKFTGNVRIAGNLNLGGTVNSSSSGFYEAGSFNVSYCEASAICYAGAKQATYVRVGKMVTLRLPYESGHTSGGQTLTWSGAPSSIYSGDATVIANATCKDNSTLYDCGLHIGLPSSGSSYIYLWRKGTSLVAGGTDSWTNSGTKGLQTDAVITYNIE